MFNVNLVESMVSFGDVGSVFEGFTSPWEKYMSLDSLILKMAPYQTLLVDATTFFKIIVSDELSEGRSITMIEVALLAEI